MFVTAVNTAGTYQTAALDTDTARAVAKELTSVAGWDCVTVSDWQNDVEYVWLPGKGWETHTNANFPVCQYL